MEYIGIDVHQRERQVCVPDAVEQVVLERRIRTTRERFAALVGTRPPARVLLEASTESEWVAQALEALGHEVVVADPNFAPMYATRRRRVKTDRRDARTLAEADSADNAAICTSPLPPVCPTRLSARPQPSSSSNAFASARSRVSKPSVNQP